MKISIRSAKASTAPHRLVPVFTEDAVALRIMPAAIRKEVKKTVRLRDFRGEPGQVLLLPFGGEQWCLAGLGEVKPLTRPRFCEAIAQGYSKLHKAGANRIDLILPARIPWSLEDTAVFSTEAVAMAGYRFDQHQTRGKKSKPVTLNLVHGATTRKAGASIGKAIQQGLQVAEGIRIARDLINQPAGVATTTYLAAEARRVARAVGAKYTQLRGEALVKAGYAAIHTVGRASEHPPILAALEYGRRRKGQPTIALVGKGIVFDSGGLDLKPSSAMALMKKDMGGAATVLGAFHAIAARKPPLHLVCVLALAENAVDARAYRPGDVLHTKQGLTVEITNTDAEGRVVLADALALARTYQPTHLIDFATLTGACRVALGRDLMGLFCDDVRLREILLASGEATGDHLWQLPLWEPYRKMLDSEVADLANAASGGMGGAITAALFLKEFAGEVAWAHIDCYAWSDGKSPLFPKGGSGAGVRLCVDAVQRLLEDSGHDRC